MIELEINAYFVTLTDYILTNQKVQLVIDRHDNKKRKIETGIPQSYLLSSIFFLIYIRREFNQVLKSSTLLMTLFYVYDLRFIASGNLIEKVVKIHKKIIQNL